MDRFAIENANGSVVATGSRIDNNTGIGVASHGGGATVNLTDCTISGNTGGGGGAYTGTFTATSCTVSGNSAGSSVGGSLAAEMAALWPQSVRRLALIAPFGLFDEKDPVTDPWAQRAPDVPGLLCRDPAIYEALKAVPEGHNDPEWPIEQTRAAEAAARIFWPLGNTKLEKRLPLITAPTLLLWGDHDAIMPRSYANRFASGVAGKTEIKLIPGAGHLAELDKPDDTAAAILAWTAGK